MANYRNRSWVKKREYNINRRIAELAFGSSLGIMRSESTDPNVVATTALIGPQVFQIIDSGDRITGPGFSTTILSACACTAGPTVGMIITRFI